MSSKQQQREYARRRYEKWLAHQQEVRARERRRMIVIGSVLGAILLAAVVWLVLDATGDDGSSSAPTPTASAPADPSTEPSEPSDEPTPEQSNGPEVPDPAIAEGRTWTARVATSAGDLVLELDGAAAPQAVASFVSLSRDGFFTGTSCHRLTTAGIFVLQCGDPTGTGTGGPDYRFGPIENAPADDVYPAGTLAMARVGNDGFSNGSQFFLVYEDSTIPADGAGGYTVFGRVVEGMDVLTAVAEAGVVEGTEQPVTTVTIEGLEVE
ncbi:peptidylprolyl isomerase [Actinotalea fermentans]|uniref:Peptidyl-prolyl cis-trans isomerase n=1 Tax=Actinotalea fermentans TaxID=43671 RepID=A0A511YUG0_9CELL|nr:peptidylprolyl isomerase [Actinotalea fermentans]KGM15749.1 peptidylprolyl isomerase [Actinotalea fermentans ATCC 43279 = JCM 9966 = DSM 3133]GEN78830.1 peptidyl-prolyl cis-trans isomerase [Actinotalea fermentans]